MRTDREVDTRIDALCDPNRNEYLAKMLRDEDFDFEKDANGKKVVLQRIHQWKAYVLDRGNGTSVYILWPRGNTGVMSHKRVVRETVKNLGPVVDGQTERGLSHCFQNDLSHERTKGKDKTNSYGVGDEFDTVVSGEPGFWHGFENPYDTVPVALLVRSEFVLRSPIE
jgi:hypothetical protein